MIVPGHTNKNGLTKLLSVRKPFLLVLFDAPQNRLSFYLI